MRKRSKLSWLLESPLSQLRDVLSVGSPGKVDVYTRKSSRMGKVVEQPRWNSRNLSQTRNRFRSFSKRDLVHVFSLFIRPIREILLIHTRILHNKHRIFLFFFLANLYEYFSAIFFFFFVYRTITGKKSLSLTILTSIHALHNGENNCRIRIF